MIYVWHDNQVIQSGWNYEQIRHRYNYNFVYDPADPDPWGQLTHGVWSPKYGDEVPKEFRLALLLMGVL